MHTFYYNIHILPLESVIPRRLSHFFVKWHLFEPVTSARVAKRLRAATDLHNTVIRCPYAAVVSSILEHPIQVWHSESESARGACSQKVSPFTPAGTPFSCRDSPWLHLCTAHPFCCVLFTCRYCLLVFYATLKQKKMNMPSTRTRWICSTRRCPLHPTLSCFTLHGK